MYVLSKYIRASIKLDSWIWTLIHGESMKFLVNLQYRMDNKHYDHTQQYQTKNLVLVPNAISLSCEKTLHEHGHGQQKQQQQQQDPHLVLVQQDQFYSFQPQPTIAGYENNTSYFTSPPLPTQSFLPQALLLPHPIPPGTILLNHHNNINSYSPPTHSSNNMIPCPVYYYGVNPQQQQQQQHQQQPAVLSTSSSTTTTTLPTMFHHSLPISTTPSTSSATTHINNKIVPINQTTVVGDVKNKPHHHDTSRSNNSTDDDIKQSIKMGRWTTAEHNLFIQGLEKYDKNWQLLTQHIGTRSTAQVRSHYQKVCMIIYLYHSSKQLTLVC
jgi:SHAQKYF class myb-like DNA-binding protein